MIDIENDVYSAVETALKAEYPNIFMAGEYVPAPASFPCVSFVEVINSIYRESSTNEQIENHAVITYEVNVYSNKTKGKKTQCKKIMSLIDEKMARLGFARRFLQPLPNMADATIYRILARYQGVADRSKTIYRR
ncbi:MAG: hypothetical protein IK072_01920 [Clostridia bacterium]|nr:hypothetical protein [Clostridia bacterium]